MAMSLVPESPRAFFTEFLPERFLSVHGDVAGRSSAGSVTFRVVGSGEWSLRLRAGELVVASAQESDVVLQATLSVDDFVPLVVDVVRRGQVVDATATRGALRALRLDEETANLLRQVRGNLLLAVLDPPIERRLLLTPGAGEPNMETPDCRVECRMDDFTFAYMGRQSPMNLFTQGKLKLSGNVQLALALGGVLSQRSSG